MSYIQRVIRPNSDLQKVVDLGISRFRLDLGFHFKEISINALRLRISILEFDSWIYRFKIDKKYHLEIENK